MKLEQRISRERVHQLNPFIGQDSVCMTLVNVSGQLRAVAEAVDAPVIEESAEAIRGQCEVCAAALDWEDTAHGRP